MQVTEVSEWCELKTGAFPLWFCKIGKCPAFSFYMCSIAEKTKIEEISCVTYLERRKTRKEGSKEGSIAAKQPFSLDCCCGMTEQLLLFRQRGLKTRKTGLCLKKKKKRIIKIKIQSGYKIHPKMLTGGIFWEQNIVITSIPLPFSPFFLIHHM